MLLPVSSVRRSCSRSSLWSEQSLDELLRKNLQKLSRRLEAGPSSRLTIFEKQALFCLFSLSEKSGLEVTRRQIISEKNTDSEGPGVTRARKIYCDLGEKREVRKVTQTQISK